MAEATQSQNMEDFQINRETYDSYNKENLKFRAAPGVTEKLVRAISKDKNEPAWMLKKRLEGFKAYKELKTPDWGPNIKDLDLEKIYFYMLPEAKKNAESWDEVPEDIKSTFDKLGIPEAEKNSLAGVGAQYESQVIYHKLKEVWEKEGVVFLDCDEALKQYPELMKKYFMTSCVPIRLHKFSALHAAVWSGGTFIYIPKGVKVNTPLQAYFRMNAKKGGQFEHTLIIVDEGAEIQYIEGCSAPQYTQNSLHAGCVEIHVLKGARARYSSIENWSKNTYNLNTKRAVVQEDGVIEWVNGNMGCLTGDSRIMTNPKGPVPIKNISPGDAIYAWDEKTNSLKKSEVVSKIYSGKKEVFKLEAGGRKLEASGNHPFLTLARKKNQPSHKKGFFHQEWKALETLQVGDMVAVARELPTTGPAKNVPKVIVENQMESKVNGQVGYARIEKITSMGIKATYDIEIEKYHNFVANGLIVHNSKVTMLYPASMLIGDRSKSHFIGIAFAGKDQNQDTGCKVTHLGKDSSSTIISKSISKDGGTSSYRGLLSVKKGALNATSNIECDALMMDAKSKSNTFPFMDVKEPTTTVAHEATVGKISDEQVFYLTSKGVNEEQAKQMIVSGFIEPIVKELPLEYAVELNRLIELEMEGSLG